MKRTTLWTALFLLATVSTAIAHGAALKTNAQSVAAGGVLHLTGVDFHEDATVRLTLVGVLNEYALVDATADSEGGFSIEVPIPADAKPGQYRVVAVVDGEEEAALDMPITAAASAEMASGDMDQQEEMASGDMDDHGSDAPMAMVDEITIQRSYSGAGWGVMGAVIGLAGGLGLGLTRTRKSAT